jgi:tetratricopeptide (TPR) repeat protein
MLVETAAKIGFSSIIGKCLPGAPLPYLPFYDAFKGLNKAPSLFQKNGSVSGTQNPALILFETLDLLRNESQKAPLLLCLEDLHWADSASIQLIHYLARNIDNLRILIVGTYRPEDLTLRQDEVHPLMSCIKTLVREGIFNDIPLGRISKDDLGIVIEAIAGSRLDTNVKALIYENSAGNPLFAVETIRMLTAEGKLVQKHGIWGLNDSEPFQIPGTIQEVILRRIDRLSKDQRRIIECASVIGEIFNSSLVSKAIEIDEPRVYDELDSIMEEHQLILGHQGQFSFTHAKIMEVTCDAITKPRRIELHRRIGLILEAELPNDSVLSALSLHFYEAQDKEKCSKYAIIAGQHFMNESYYFEGITQFNRALEMIPDDHRHLSEREAVIEGLGDVYREQCLSSKSMEYYDLLLKDEMDPKDRARVLWKSAENWNPANLGRGDPSHAIRLLHEAEMLEAASLEDRANIEFQKAYSLYYHDLEKAAVSLEKAIELYTLSGNFEMMMEAIKHDCYIKVRRLRYEEAIEEANDLLEKAYQSNNRKFQIVAEWTMGAIQFQMDNYEAAKKHLELCQDLAMKSGDLDALFHAHITKSEMEEDLGQYDSAIKNAEKALNYAIATDDTIAYASAHTRLGRCNLHCGNLNEATIQLETAWPFVEQLTGVLRKWFEGLWLWSAAELESSISHFREANEHFDKAIGLLEEAGSRHWDWAAWCHYKYAESLVKQNEREPAKDHLDLAYCLCTIIKRFSLRKKVELLQELL